MVRITGEIVINRPAGEVFDFVADERNEPRYNPRMLRAEKTSPGPVGLGTRFQAQMRSMGRPLEMTVEYTAFERPRLLASSTRLSTMEIDGTLTFDAVPDGTRMRWVWDLRPRGVLKLTSPLLGRLGRRQERAIWASLKRVLETQDAAPSASA